MSAFNFGDSDWDSERVAGFGFPTFVGGDIESLYNLVVKLQKQYTNQTK